MAVYVPSLSPTGGLGGPTQLVGLVPLQNISRTEVWHDWFVSLERNCQGRCHGLRFDIFYMCIRAAQANCGVVLLPCSLAEEEFAENKPVIAQPYVLLSQKTYYLTYPGHVAEIPKIHHLIEWVIERLEQEQPSASPRQTRHDPA